MTGADDKAGRTGGGGGAGKRRRSGGGAGRDDLPRRLGDIITPSLDRLAGGDEARAYAAWARAVGEPVTAGTRPKAFRRGQLTVECASSVWANELTYLGPQILRRMDEVAPGHPVKRFRFIVGRLPAAADADRAPETALSASSPGVGSEAAGAGIRGSGGEEEASARTARAGHPRRGAGPGGGSRRRTTPGGHRGRSATVIAGASRGSRSRHPIWLTKIAGLRRFYPGLRVALSLTF